MSDEIEQTEQEIVNHAALIAAETAKAEHVFTHAWLDSALGVGSKPRQTDKFQAWQIVRMRRVEAWRAQLLIAHGIHVESLHARGYKVIAQQDTAEVAERKAVREMRRANVQGANKLIYARRDELTAAQVTRRHEALGKLGMIRQAIEMSRPRPPRPPGYSLRQWERELLPPEEEGAEKRAG
jgi:hypothetical protein